MAVGPTLHTLEFNRRYVHDLVADISPEKMCDAAGTLTNHPAWQIGHLTVILGYAGTMLGLDTMLEQEWLDLFDRGSTVDHEQSHYPQKQELLGRFDDLHDTLARGLRGATEELLDQPTPERFQMRAFAPTIRDAVCFLLTWHEGAHAGQIAAWRRAKGLDNVL